jgi:predicted Rossmann fold nucleotide-binding protein DprA/Smf involved in DNA uptake
MALIRIKEGDSDYPPGLRDWLGKDTPQCLHAMGRASVLRQDLLGMVCSVQCPGSVILKTFDTVRALRDAGMVVAGGFHSPMERECLDFLLRGTQPVVHFAARGLQGLRLGSNARKALEEGRLTVISPFGDTVRRTTAPQAELRNTLVAALSRALWVPHAAPGGKTWALVQRAIVAGLPIYTFADAENRHLIDAGALDMSLFNPLTSD